MYKFIFIYFKLFIYIMETIKNNFIDPTITISSTEINQLNINFSDVSNLDKIYNKSEKKMIASRIEQIKNKKVYLKLFKIISDDKNNYTLNSNGIFLNLNNVHDSTLFKIEKVLDMYDNIKKNKIIDSKWNNHLQIQYNTTNHEIIDDKLSNHEKLFLKRQQNINEKEITYWGGTANDL